MPHCEIEETLERLALHKTKDRHRILELFDQKRAWTARQIHTNLRTTNLATVYRNLHKLKEAELIADIHSHGSKQYFEKRQDIHHDHLICDSCEIVKCVPCPIPKQPAHFLELTGVCRQCT